MKNHIISLAVALLLGVMAIGSAADPENVVIDVDAPISTKVGDEFEITVKITNTDTKSQSLVSVDVGDEYLEGIAITRTVPNYTNLTHIPIDNSMSYEYDRDIASGEEMIITMYAKALKSGDYNGDIDICINSEMSFLTRSLRTYVEGRK